MARGPVGIGVNQHGEGYAIVRDLDIHVGDRISFRYVDVITMDDSRAIYGAQCAGVVVHLPTAPGWRFKVDIDERPEGWDYEGDELEDGYYVACDQIIGLLPASMERTDVEGWLVR